MSVLPVQNDRVQLTTESGDVWMNGLLMNGDKAVYATSSPVNYSNGIQRTASGAIYCVDATAGLPAGATWTNGLPFSVLGALCISNNAVVTWSNGIPFDANGAVCAAYLPIPDLDLDFTLGILDPRITFSRATGATVTGSNGLIQFAPMNLPRFDYDPVTLQPKGLLIEEQRTNLLTYSEQFDNAAWAKLTGGTGVAPVVTANAAVAPNGTTTADQVVFNRGAGTSGSDISYLAFSLTAFTATATASVYLKTTDGTTKTMSFRCGAPAAQQITVTGEWQRFTLTQTNATIDRVQILLYGNDGAQTVSVNIWGAQLEAGAFATSYIPTVASQVTRAADSASMTGTNFSSWYNQTEGTIFAEATALANFTSASVVAEIGDGTLNNRFNISRVGSLNQAVANTVVGGAVQASISTFPAFIPTVSSKTSSAIKVDDFAASSNGGAAATDTSGLVPNVSQIALGATTTGIARWNGTIARIAYFNRRLANTELTAITS
jgi:hypothetical protein